MYVQLYDIDLVFGGKRETFRVLGWMKEITSPELFHLISSRPVHTPSNISRNSNNWSLKIHKRFLIWKSNVDSQGYHRRDGSNFYDREFKFSSSSGHELVMNYLDFKDSEKKYITGFIIIRHDEEESNLY